MLLHCRGLPRFLFPISTSNPPPPSLYAHLLLFPNKRTTFASPFSRSASFAPRSHLAVPVSAPSESFLDTDEDHQIQIPLEKLFVPPEVELPEGSAAAALGRVLKGSNIVLGPYARDAQVTTAEFVKSSVRTEDCPADGLPEFALVGRSNVGKSSLLNSLVRRKRLALTSKKPGRAIATFVSSRFFFGRWKFLTLHLLPV